jgi:hypothetical protein
MAWRQGPSPREYCSWVQLMNQVARRRLGLDSPVPVRHRDAHVIDLGHRIPGHGDDPVQLSLKTVGRVHRTRNPADGIGDLHSLAHSGRLPRQSLGTRQGKRDGPEDVSSAVNRGTRLGFHLARVMTTVPPLGVARGSRWVDMANQCGACTRGAEAIART